MRLVAILPAAALLAACAACSMTRAPRAPVPQYPTDVVRYGPERLAVAYDDPHRADKDLLLARINRDRVAAGVPPVSDDPRAALVGDLFCLDAAMAGTSGHWDLAGRPPFLRWAQKGGVDFHTENATSYSISSGRIDRPLAELLLQAHDGMMAERAPADGHRRTVLNPHQTHVGIGLAVVGGELRMTEEFTAAALDWIEIPAHALRAGEWATIAAGIPAGLVVSAIEIRHLPEPHALTRRDLAQRGAYSYPPIAHRYDPRLPEGVVYRGSGRGDFEVHNGRVSLAFPLDQGPGHYFVLTYVHRVGDAPYPVTAAMVTAEP